MYLKNVERREIKEWIREEIETVERALSKDVARLQDLFPEYRELMSTGATYSTAYGSPSRRISEDLIDKLLTVEYVFAPIYRRASLEAFESIYGLRLDEYLDLLIQNDRLVPMSMAPPWGLEKPRFYLDIINRLRKAYGFYPPPAWVRITEYFVRRMDEETDWEDVMRSWRKRVKRLAKGHREGIERLMRRYKREANEIIDIITTRSAQLELFGYKDVLERIYAICERLNNVELLYFTVSSYHRFLIGSVLDYVGDIPIWWDVRRHREDYLNVREELKRLGIPQYPQLLQELLLRLYTLKSEFLDLTPVRLTEKLIKVIPIVDKVMDSSKDYFQFMRRVNEAAKLNLEEVLKLSERYDEVIKNHIDFKAKVLRSITKVTSKIVFFGLTSLAGSLYVTASGGLSFTFKEIEKALRHAWYAIFSNALIGYLGIEYLNEYMEELTRKGIEYILKKSYLKSDDPLRVFYGKGIVWLIWLIGD